MERLSEDAIREEMAKSHVAGSDAAKALAHVSREAAGGGWSIEPDAAKANGKMEGLTPWEYFQRFKLFEGACWEAYVSERGGNNLGRVYFWLKRDGIIDFHDLTMAELSELRVFARVFTRAIKKLFSPDGPMNFAYLANEPGHGHHCHYHLVPRYARAVLFAGKKFEDERWGKQWASRHMPEELAIAVGKAIVKELNWEAE